MLNFNRLTILAGIIFSTAIWGPIVEGKSLKVYTVSTDSVAIDSLLMRITHASENISYSGVHQRFVKHRGQRIELRWQENHWHPDRTVVIFLSPKDQRDLMTVLQGDQIKYKCNQHKDRTFHYGGPEELLKNGKIFKEIALLRRNYFVEAFPRQPFLNRPTISLKVTPRHPGRPALHALIDAESGLLLQVKRSPVGMPNDSLVIINQFVEFSPGKPDAAIFTSAWSDSKHLKKSRKAKIYTDLDALLTSYKGRVLIPKKLPAGFALLQIKSIQRRRKSYLHFLYGDGLTFISLFQNRENRDSSHRRGNQQKYSRDNKGDKDRESFRSKENQKKDEHHSPYVIIRGKQGNLAYSIIGEIPRTELDEMAESLEVIE